MNRFREWAWTACGLVVDTVLALVFGIALLAVVAYGVTNRNLEAALVTVAYAAVFIALPVFSVFRWQTNTLKRRRITLRVLGIAHLPVLFLLFIAFFSIGGLGLFSSD